MPAAVGWSVTGQWLPSWVKDAAAAQPHQPRRLGLGRPRAAVNNTLRDILLQCAHSAAYTGGGMVLLNRISLDC
jgi:hypothetical protein